jgi:hypothetical protein
MDKPPMSAPITGEAPRKRGRPAGSTNNANSAPKTNSDVEQALATLETAYQFMAIGLTMFGAVQAAGDLASKIDALQDSNRGFLIADKRLAQQIAKAGSASGRAGFMITNLVAFAPVVMTAVTELSAKRVASKPQPAKPAPAKPATTPQPSTPVAEPAPANTAPVSNYGIDINPADLEETI